MNLWIINHYAYAPDHCAGTRHWSLARRLIDRGHSVTVVSTSFFHKACAETRLAKGQAFRHELVDGVPFLWLRSRPYKGNTLGRFWNMVDFARRVIREEGLRDLPRPDVILGSTPDLLAARAAARLADRYGVPFVLEVRDLWPETFVSMGHMRRWHPLVQFFASVERKLYRRADRIVTLLPNAMEYIQQHGGGATPVDWIPNGIDLGMVPRIAPPASGEKFTLMYAGAHGAVNNLDLLLDAAKQLRANIRVELVGDGREKSRLQQRARDEGIDNVQFLPPVAKREIYPLLETADAFAFILKGLSVFRWGISPNKIYDYLACGRPVVLTGDVGRNPIAEARAGVTVPAGDAAALAAGITDLACLPRAERLAMGERGRAYVERHHNLDVLAGRLEESLLKATGCTTHTGHRRHAA